MSRIPEHIVDQIIQTARIEEVIGEFVQLKRAGSNLKGLSPFTAEKTPSFVVSPAKQIYKCFSTSKGGNVVSFIMEKEHFSYPEALRWLADKYNIELPKEEELSAEQLAAANEKDSLFIINEFAKNHFMETLHETDEGKSIGLSYFTERGFHPDIIKRFQLGYCKNTGTDLTKAALDKGFKFEYLDKVGLSKEKDGRQFDFFKGRVIFPIHSISGRVLGFGGRTLLSDKKVAKYFNSPESPVYNKSEILYGLYFAKGEIVKKDECLLCEGYTDVISMHQAGIQHAVSSSGTSLTREQIRLVSRYTKNITILYDGDAAGIKASFRGIDLILEEGLNVKVVLFPEGEDPDSFAKKSTTDELNEFLESHRQDFISFKAGLLLKGTENDPLQKAKLIKDIVYSISLIPDSITRTIYAKQIASSYQLAEEMIVQEVTKHRAGKFAEEVDEPWVKDAITAKPILPKVNVQEVPKDEALVEKELIRLMLKFGNKEVLLDPNGDKIPVSVNELVIQELNSDDLSFKHPVCYDIFGEIVDGVAEGILYTYKYFLKSSNSEILNLTTQLIGFEDELSPKWATQYRIYTKQEDSDLIGTVLYAIYNFKQYKITEHIKGLRLQLASDGLSQQEQLELLAEQMAYEKIKQTFSEKLGRIIIK